MWTICTTPALRNKEKCKSYREWRFFCHKWGDAAMIFTSDEVTSENRCRIASRVTKKFSFTVTNVLFYFLHSILCHEYTNPLKTIIERSFCHCCQERSFLTKHCDNTTIDLWCHANARYWYCDVISIDCHCTRKLVQRRSSLVNNPWISISRHPVFTA